MVLSLDTNQIFLQILLDSNTWFHCFVLFTGSEDEARRRLLYYRWRQSCCSSMENTWSSPHVYIPIMWCLYTGPRLGPWTEVSDLPSPHVYIPIMWCLYTGPRLGPWTEVSDLPSPHVYIPIVWCLYTGPRLGPWTEVGHLSTLHYICDVNK